MGKALPPDEIFAPDPFNDIYSSVIDTLGPSEGVPHRRAVMLEVLRVLAGFESSWNWNEGRDTTNPTSVTPDSIEAGAWQVSANAMNFGQELKELTGQCRDTRWQRFPKGDETNHPLAIEFIARLLRRTTHHNGPVSRHEIDPSYHNTMRDVSVGGAYSFLLANPRHAELTGGQ